MKLAGESIRIPSGLLCFVGDGLVLLAAPDIILETAVERQNPDRAARVMAVPPGCKGEIGQANIALPEKKGVSAVPSPL
jgi:hypothetical protein